MKRVFSNLLFIIGIFSFLATGYLIGERTFPKNLSFQGDAGLVSACIDHNKIPIGIRIPSLSINLPIIPSVIRNGIWETTMNGASYLLTSPVPGQKGNSIIYGHNYSNLLGKLPAIKPGQEIDIYYNDMSMKRFRVEYTSVVDPSQTDVLKQTNDKRITIYTCTGLFDSKRFVTVAELIV